MTNKSLIEFPCSFPIKIVGQNSDDFIEQIKDIVLTHFPNFQDQHLLHKKSSQANYLAITVTVYAENQEMLDALYQDLSTHPLVKMVL